MFGFQDAEEPDDGFEEEDNGESYEVESYTSRDGQVLSVVVIPKLSGDPVLSSILTCT